MENNNGNKPVRVGDTITVKWTKTEIKKLGKLTDEEAQRYYIKGAKSISGATKKER